jgi:uncharacterized membrane protein YkvA (DUF1232 family)
MINPKENIAKIEIETYALYLAGKDPRIPLHIKIIIILVIAYLLSPIDLIPDFIPIIGYLDDLLLITVGIPLLLRAIPKEIMDEHRKNAKSKLNEGMKKSWIVALIIILIWFLAAVILFNFLRKFF